MKVTRRGHVVLTLGFLGFFLAGAAQAAPGAPVSEAKISDAPVPGAGPDAGAAAGQDAAQTEQAAPQKGAVTGLPLPRFASLASGKANMRVGPGRQYPIKWVYERKTLPVEIINEYDVWRMIRDPDGESGWVNAQLLSGDRTAYVQGKIRTLRMRPDSKALPTWRVEPGVIAHIVFCARQWCQVGIGGRSGFIQRDEIWGVYPDEVIGE